MPGALEGVDSLCTSQGRLGFGFSEGRDPEVLERGTRPAPGWLQSPQLSAEGSFQAAPGPMLVSVFASPKTLRLRPPAFPVLRSSSRSFRSTCSSPVLWQALGDSELGD